MRKNIQQVIAAFNQRKPKRGATCSTDGVSIFSYSTEIARRLPNGLVWVTSQRISNTTNSQVRAIEMSLGRWDGEEWHYENLIRTSTLEELCAHGQDDESPDANHCWQNAEMMRACNHMH